MSHTRSTAAEPGNPERDFAREAAGHPAEAETQDAVRQTDGGDKQEEVRNDSANLDAETPDAGTEEAGTENPADEAANGGEAEKYRQEAEKFRQEAEENHQRLLRLQADYDNFRRRTRQEKEEFAKYASQSVVERLLPVLDNFERALAAGRNAADLESFIKGVDMIYRQLSDVLAQEGLEAIAAVGEPFNPEFHQAVMQVESDEHEDGVVVEEFQKGYKLKQRVIRPSMVKVNARP